MMIGLGVIKGFTIGLGLGLFILMFDALSWHITKFKEKRNKKRRIK